MCVILGSLSLFLSLPSLPFLLLVLTSRGGVLRFMSFGLSGAPIVRI